MITQNKEEEITDTEQDIVYPPAVLTDKEEDEVFPMKSTLS